MGKKPVIFCYTDDIIVITMDQLHLSLVENLNGFQILYMKN